MKKTRLVVIAPGLKQKKVRYEPLIDRLKQEPALDPSTTEWLTFDQVVHPAGFQPLESYAGKLEAKINSVWSDNEGFDDIILMGHSAGGLLVRRAYLLAWGSRQWAKKVSRIVLLAAPNRGVAKLEPMNRIGHFFARIFLFWMHFTYQDLLEGSRFITNLRIDWIRHFRSAAAEPPIVLQLRGDNDNAVSVDASRDVLSMPNSAPVSIPDSDHLTMVDLPSRVGTAELEPIALTRYRFIRRAILDGPEALGLNPRAPQTMPAESAVRDLIFVLHGIRARSRDNWLGEIKKQIEARSAAVKTVLPGYEYLTAYQFILPSVRRRNIRLLQDAYTEHLAEYPDARFHIIAHSNGTYMLCQSLKDIPAMHFERVVLAASVLPCDVFEPQSPMRGRAIRVRADGGQRDVPVGVLCRLLRNTLRMRDLGTAGYDGFTGGFVTEYWHAGGHSDMFTGRNIQSMVTFILDQSGEIESEKLGKDGWFFPMFARLSPFLVALLLAAILFFPVAGIFFPGLAVNPWHWYLGLAVVVAAAAIFLDTF